MSNPQMHPQTAQSLALLAQRLAGSKHRKPFLSMVHDIDPSFRLPADVEVAALETKLRNEAAENQKKQQEANWKNRRSKQRKELVESHGEDVVKAIEEGVLKKYPHMDYEDAARLHAAQEGPVLPPTRDATPANRHGQLWEFPGIPGLMENPEKAASDMAYAMIDEFRAGKRAY